MMISILRTLLYAVAATGLSGCAAEYACPVPKTDGGCRSVAQVYQDTRHSSGITPSAGVAKSDASGSEAIAHGIAADTSIPPPSPGTALLTTPHVLRVWLAPWQDADGDLEAGGFLFLRLDRGQWTMPPPR
jgi:conjugal transfer pilus assembly protein TraV